MVHQSACFFHRWAGRPTPLSCSFAASLAEQRAKSKQQRPGWRGRKLRVPAAGGGGSVSTLEAPSGAGGHRARHRSSLLSQVPAWSAPGRAQEGRFRGGAGAWSRGAGASCPRSFGPSLRLRRPTVQSPGCWRALGCTLRGCEGGEAGGGRGGVVLSWPPVGRGGEVGSRCADSSEHIGPGVARKPPHATERLAPAASGRGGGGSHQQPLLGAAWAGHW